MADAMRGRFANRLSRVSDKFVRSRQLRSAELPGEGVFAGLSLRIAVLVRGAADIAADTVIRTTNLAMVGGVDADQRGEIVVATRAGAIAARFADLLTSSARAD